MANASRALGRVGHRLRNPVAVAVRDAVMRAVPTPLALRGMAKFLGWTPPSLSPDR
ncbi:MAG: hypothetical protein HOV94_27650 [Saccharothrix sp.]|nr:hypothetical protein [Saccharothrix sp.]